MRADSGDRRALTAGIAPRRGERLSGRKKMSAKGSYQRFILIMPESTTPGSQQFMRTPRAAAAGASERAWSVMSFLERA